MVLHDFDDVALEDLRLRRSAKWSRYPPDVLPMWVAELDVSLADVVTGELTDAVTTGDTGYAWPERLAPAFAGFAARQWGWQVEPPRCWAVADVMVGVGEALRMLTSPGDPVVVCPPVYTPFFHVPAEHGRPVVQVPLVDGGLDLAGIDAALAAGARAVLLCSPHNPTGRVWAPAELAALDEVARRHAVIVVSDEIHAPLTLPGATFTPYLAEGPRHAVAVVSASKAFNLAGLKAALLVAGSDDVADRLRRLPEEVAFRCGHLGVLASVAAWRHGDDWLADLRAHLDRNRQLLGELLAAQLPGVGYAPPQASYLAWLDFRAVGLEAPAAHLLEHGRVALVEGTDFGAPGAGFARLNLGTTRAVLEDGVRRMCAARG
ncbi:MAG TPA: aminotransferase class I/II-fold pyridoxal phosphate-dependent enzyme [Mycobacteriales bacterium]|nr:aminotransferase class I/II-fold pyridoxal phosphate-dependent enzyme [Mycobacteriales bacterium]